MIYIAVAVLVGDGFGALRQGGMCSLEDSATGETEGPEAFSPSWIALLKNAPIFFFAMNGSTAYVPVRYQHRTCLGHLLMLGSSWNESERDYDTENGNDTSAVTVAAATTIKRESRAVIARAVSVAGSF